MGAYEIVEFRKHLKENDPENRELRRIFHENFEWLDGYWRTRWRSKGNNAIFEFCNQFGTFYWETVSGIAELGVQLGKLGPIGSSRNEDFSSTKEIDQATFDISDPRKTSERKFTAMMELVRQIRNNLFHGMKMELSHKVAYERNKNLIRHAGQITDIILDHLIEAEENANAYKRAISRRRARNAR